LHDIIYSSLRLDYGCDPDDYTEGTVNLVDYNTNKTETGCSIYEMVDSAESAGVTALLMMRTEDDSQSTPPNVRLYSKTTPSAFSFTIIFKYLYSCLFLTILILTLFQIKRWMILKPLTFLSLV
jgi:hypothetical protein